MRLTDAYGILCFTDVYALCSPFIGFFKGTSADQDRRFSDKELKLLKTMKFPPEFEKKVCVPCDIHLIMQILSYI